MPIDPIKAIDADRLNLNRSQVAPAAPIAINRESQLLVDDHLVARRESLFRRLNRPTKRPGPILSPETPEEGIGLYYGSVLEEEDSSDLRLYYISGHSYGTISFEQFRAERGHSTSPMFLARSTDGVTFSREPVAGSVFPGTHIVADENMDCLNVLHDPQDPDPSRRYKLLASKDNWPRGLTPATSPDGIHWTWGEDNAVAWFGDRCAYWYDPIRRTHVAWSRDYHVLPQRVIAQCETSDFGDWGNLRENHPRVVLQADRLDHPSVEFYGGYAFWYRSVYLAYLEVYHMQQQRIDTQLCCSRDGRRWTRLCDRETFIPNGEHGEWDAYWVVPTFNPPILRDGELLIHTNGRPDPHPQPGFSASAPGFGGAFGLTTLREDGFVSLDATGRVGLLVTHPLTAEPGCRTLAINCCQFATRPGMEPMSAVVSLHAPDGEAIGVWELSYEPDRVWYAVELAATPPAGFHLEFRLQNCRLYSFKLS